jgi:hypothetical protein
VSASCSWGEKTGSTYTSMVLRGCIGNPDDRGQRYVCSQEWHFERADFDAELSSKMEAALAAIGEALESVYDESYIERKKEALERASIPHERIEIEPEDLFMN